MRLLLLLILITLCPVLALGQARTAERIVSVPFSQLDPGSRLPNGSIAYVINGVQGTTPCQGAGTGAMAVKIAGTWHCPSLTPGSGSGDVLGAASSISGQLVAFTTTSGKNIGPVTITGVLSVVGGIPSALPSSGTGSVVLSNSATLNAATLLTPIINSFNSAQHAHDSAVGGGQLNASTVFNTGTIPPVRVITGAVVNSRCLRTSNVGQIEVAAADCGVGGGGSPGGVSGNLTFNESGAFGGATNSAYNAATGTFTFSQLANGNDTLVLRRFTDSASTGTLLRMRDSANSTDLFSVSASGAVFGSSIVTLKAVAAPTTPSTGNTVIWADSTDKNLKAKDDAGNVLVTVRPVTCTGTDKVSAVTSAGVVTCTADQTSGGGSGITTLNTLTAASQTFADVDDANVTLDITSTTSTHTFTLGWTGTLAKSRQHAATVYSDQANTWTTGAQDFGAAASLVIPKAVGASPTASGDLRYDTTSNTAEMGVNGTNRTIAFTAGTQTISDKTLDNSNAANLKDSSFTLQDNVDATKTVNFELGGLTNSTNRVVTIANAPSVTVQPTTATTNQFVTHIDSAGVVQKAQPSFSNLSGSLAVTQGSTGQTTVAQGDLLYSDATNSWARLAKSTTATRYLSNTGTSNAPAWAQVNLTNGVTGLLPPANWSPLTTKGDLLGHNGTTSVRFGVGSDGTCLKANSTQTTGFEWGTCGSGTGDMLLAGVQTVTGAKTFDPAKLIIGNVSAAPTPVLGALYVDTDDGKLYYGIDGSTWGEVFVSGLSVVNLASANVTGTLPVANGGTGFTDTTFSGSTHKLTTTTGTLTSGRCAEWDASGNLIQSGAACGTTVTVASGTSALGTSAISSGACATVVTTSATGTATTDVIGWGFNGDPTGVTGYQASVNGMLTIIAYPSANNVNFKVCNNTSASITPGAVTLNWRVTR